MVRISSKITYNDLTGGLNAVSNIDTINATPRRTETPDIVNVEHFKLGGIKTMEGNLQIGDKQSASVIGGWEYTKNGRKYFLIGLKTGEVKILNTVTNVFDTIYTFSTPTDRISFCNMNNGVVVTNGIDDPFFYDRGRRQILTGTVSLTEASVDVVGLTTKFTVEVKKGDELEIDGNKYFVEEVTDDTNLKLTTGAVASVNNSNYYLSELSQCNATLINEEDPTIQTPIRGLAIQYYNGRLWIGSDNGLFYSQVGMYNGWDIKYDAGVLYSIYNDSSSITALGLYSDYMLVHKEHNTYILNCTGDSTTITVAPYSNVSCGSQQSWIVSNTKYFVYSRENMDIYPLTQRTVFSDKYIGEPLTQKVRDIFSNLREEDTDKIFCVSYPKKRWMVFYLPMVDQLGSSYGLVYDFQTKSFLVRKVPQEVTIAFNFDNRIYIGTVDGYVLKEFTGLTFNGTPIEAYYRSPWFDWADGYTQSFAEFTITTANDFNNSFYIRTYKDGGSPFEDRILSGDTLATEALIWDGIEGQDLRDNYTRWDEDDWVISTFNDIRMVLPNNVFGKFQLEIGVNQTGQAFAIYGYQFRRVETEEAPWG